MRDGTRGGAADLYDLAADPVETRDLAGAHPDRAAAMERQWRARAVGVGAKEAAK